MNENYQQSEWIICFGGSVSKLPIIKAIKSRGFRCCVVDINSNCVCKQHSDLFLNLSITEPHKIIEQLEKHQMKNDVALVIPYTSLRDGQFSAFQVSKKLKIPCWSQNALNYAWNKKLFKKLCENTSIPTPRSFLPSQVNQLKKFINEKGSLICKPLMGVGSKSIFTVDSLHQLDLTLKKTNSVFFEEYLEGNLYSIDGLVSQNNIVFCLFSRKFIRKNSFTIDGFELDGKHQLKNELLALAKKFVIQNKINNTFFGFDVLFNNNSFYFIDFGLLMDGEIDRLLAFAGVDIFKAFIDSILKLRKVKVKEINRIISMAFLYSNRDGIIKKLPKPHEILKKTHSVLEYNKLENELCSKELIVENKIGHVIKDVRWDKIKIIAKGIEDEIIIK